MDLSALTQTAVDFVRANQGWGFFVVLALAFGESLAFVSFLVPATVILLGIGVLIGESGISFWPLWAAAAIGAFLGDWLSFWIGLKLKHDVVRYWPLSRHPDLLERGHRFFERWGVLGVFFGRFFGPLRAVMPLVAGICEMSPVAFQIANVTSAVLWAAVMLAPGAFGLKLVQGWI